MVRCCSVNKCGKKGRKDGVTLFGVPPNEPEKSKWIQFIKNANSGRGWCETTKKYVCSSHFETNQLCHIGKGNDLMRVPGSVPSLLNENTTNKGNSTELSSITFELNSIDVQTTDKWGISNKTFSDKNIQVDSSKCAMKKKDRVIRNLRSTVEKQRRIIARKSATIKLYRLKLNKYRKRESRGIKRKSTEALAETTVTKKACFEPPDDTLGERLLKELLNRVEKRKCEKYSEDLREFAFELHYFSPRSYQKLRERIPTFPHPRTFRKWTEHVDTSPGFMQQAVDFIKKRVAESTHPLFFALSYDEIHIRKQTVAFNGGFIGFVDHSEFAEEPMKENKEEGDEKEAEKDGEKCAAPPAPPKEATAALFCMATEINGSHKIPLAYILTNGLHSKIMKRVILKTVDKIAELGARVISVTFDGLAANLTAVGALGANLDVRSPSLQPYFLDSSGNRVHVILDASHMIKLTRNLLKEYGTLENSNGELIKWDYVVKLQALQNEEGLRAANKLTVNHTHYDNNKMKTKLAAQTLSGSTSVALRFARELGLEGFEHSEATEEFLGIMNRLFDYLNSIPSGQGNRAPLRYSSMQFVSNFFTTCKSYLLGLKKVHPLGDVEAVPLLETPRKTAVRGLVITMTSILNIVTDYLSDPSSSLKYLPTFKVSQDPLENFFSLVRSRLGFNNNPNVLQLRYALRGIVCMNTKAINSGNCIEQEDLSTLISSLGNFKSIVNVPDEQKRILRKTEEDTVPFSDLSPFSSNIVMYISGFVARSLVEKLQCPLCVYKLYACEADVPLISSDSKLLMLKDNGGLFLTSFAVFSVCTIAEKIIRSKKEHIHELSRDFLQEAVQEESGKQGLVYSLSCGVTDDSYDHTKELIKQLVRKYWSVR